MLRIIEPKIPISKSPNIETSVLDIDSALSSFSAYRIDFGDKPLIQFDESM